MHGEPHWSEEDIEHLLRLAGSHKLERDDLWVETHVRARVSGREETVASVRSHDLADIRAALERAGVHVELPGDAAEPKEDPRIKMLAELERRREDIARMIEDLAAREDMEPGDIFDAVVERLVREWNLPRERAEDEALDLLDAHLSESLDFRLGPPPATTFHASRLAHQHALPAHRRQRYTKQADNPLGPLDTVVDEPSLPEDPPTA